MAVVSGQVSLCGEYLFNDPGGDKMNLVLYSAHCFLCVGVEGFTTEEDQEMIGRIEKQLKRRFVIGSQVSEHAIVQDFLKQVSDI